MIRVLLNGCCGKMGRMFTEMAQASGDVTVVAGVDVMRGDMDYPVFAKLSGCDISADVALDFSRPEALPELVDYCRLHHCALVVATTGLTVEDKARLREVSATIPVFHSANFSLGINLMLSLVGQTAAALNGFDIEIIETHHNQKNDAPSGTALMLADCANEALRNARSYMFGRNGKHARRAVNEIGIHAVRGGTVAGDHEMLFFGEDESVAFKHHITSRRVFAAGALQAVRYMAGRNFGFYNMTHVLAHHLEPVHIERTEKVILTETIPEGMEAMAGTLIPPRWIVPDEAGDLVLFRVSGVPFDGTPLWKTAQQALNAQQVPIVGLWTEGHATALAVDAIYMKSADECLMKAFGG